MHARFRDAEQPGEVRPGAANVIGNIVAEDFGFHGRQHSGQVVDHVAHGRVIGEQGPLIVRDDVAHVDNRGQQQRAVVHVGKPAFQRELRGKDDDLQLFPGAEADQFVRSDEGRKRLHQLGAGLLVIDTKASRRLQPRQHAVSVNEHAHLGDLHAPVSVFRLFHAVGSDSPERDTVSS